MDINRTLRTRATALAVGVTRTADSPSRPGVSARA